MTLPESTVAALTKIADEGCQNFTSGDCYDQGRREDAMFASGMPCYPCRIKAALDAPPPAMGGLPELREVITWWCPNHLKARPEKGRCIHRDRSVEPFECDDAIALVARDGVGG